MKISKYIFLFLVLFSTPLSAEECKVNIGYADAWYSSEITKYEMFTLSKGEEKNVNVEHMRKAWNEGDFDVKVFYDYGWWSSDAKTVLKGARSLEKSGNLKIIKCLDPRIEMPAEVLAVNLIDPVSGPSTNTPTAYVQFQWTDQSAGETKYSINAFLPGAHLISGGIAFQEFNYWHAAIPNTGSKGSLVVTDLPSGRYTFEVCTGPDRFEKCNRGRVGSFIIDQGCKPKILSTARLGSATGRVSWSFNCETPPNNFNIKLRCGNSPLGVVAVTGDSNARSETFNLGIGEGTVYVCASYPNSREFCSNAKRIQCN